MRLVLCRMLMWQGGMVMSSIFLPLVRTPILSVVRTAWIALLGTPPLTSELTWVKETLNPKLLIGAGQTLATLSETLFLVSLPTSRVVCPVVQIRTPGLMLCLKWNDELAPRLKCPVAPCIYMGPKQVSLTNMLAAALLTFELSLLKILVTYTGCLVE